MSSKRSESYGKGVVAIDEDEALLSLLTPIDLIERFRDPSYRPPVLPSVALELYELSRRVNFDYKHAIRILERDPIIAARVLRTSQSPAFASRVPVKSLDDALSRLGIDVLSQIVFEVTAGMTLFRVRGYEPIMERVRRHSTAVAYIARAVAHATKQPTELAFLCGLFHDIGVVACLLVYSGLNKGKPPDFDDVWPTVCSIHCEVSQLLAQLWQLPVEVHRVLGHHHDPGMHNRQASDKLAGAVFVADAIATQLGFGMETPPDPATFDSECRTIALGETIMPQLMEYAQTVVAQIE